MNALGFIRQSIDSKQNELTQSNNLGCFNNDANRIYAHTDNYSVHMDYSDGYGNAGYSDDWGDYTVSNDD
jgi:hypothetical protein